MLSWAKLPYKPWGFAYTILMLSLECQVTSCVQHLCLAPRNVFPSCTYDRKCFEPWHHHCRSDLARWNCYFCLFFAEVFAVEILSALCLLVSKATDKNTCTRALWVISKQSFPAEEVAKKVSSTWTLCATISESIMVYWKCCQVNTAENVAVISGAEAFPKLLYWSVLLLLHSGAVHTGNTGERVEKGRHPLCGNGAWSLECHNQVRFIWSQTSG